MTRYTPHNIHDTNVCSVYCALEWLLKIAVCLCLVREMWSYCFLSDRISTSLLITIGHGWGDVTFVSFFGVNAYSFVQHLRLIVSSHTCVNRAPLFAPFSVKRVSAQKALVVARARRRALYWSSWFVFLSLLNVFLQIWFSPSLFRQMH